MMRIEKSTMSAAMLSVFTVMAMVVGSAVLIGFLPLMPMAIMIDNIAAQLIWLVFVLIGFGLLVSGSWLCVGAFVENAALRKKMETLTKVD